MDLGSSLAVENVQELASSKLEDIPQRYIRSETELQVEDIPTDECFGVPVIDMAKLASCPNEMKRLHQACDEWGFFQLINHGCVEAIEKMKMVTQEFFKLPLEEKMACALLPDDLEGYGQHFVASDDQKLDWGDLLFLRVLPVHRRNIALWPKAPNTFRETLEEYSWELHKIYRSLCKCMASNLGLHTDQLSNLYEDASQAMRMNYYPPCPQADKVIGLSPHSDGDGLTLLVQLNEVDGLQIKHNNNWVPVKPVSDRIVVNIGDLLEIISNGKYKSVEHRAMVNYDKERLSIAAFHSPTIKSMIGPLPDLLNNAPNYKTVKVEEYYKLYMKSKLEGKSTISQMKINAMEE